MDLKGKCKIEFSEIESDEGMDASTNYAICKVHCGE